jgi:GMP synthase (glutamine-hydrolysing)
MLREKEGDQVEAIFAQRDIHFVRVNAADSFREKLAGVTDPQEKRQIINKEFVRIFELEAKKLGTVDFLAQGTIYPDVIEAGYTDVVNSTHKGGLLPENIGFHQLLEPLRYLFKEEVRELGRTIGLPETLVNRQPFPGPGLAIRIIGAITEEKLRILRKADAIFTSALENAHIHEQVSQYFAVLTDNLTIDITGSDRTPRYTLALRVVNTDDYITAKWTRLPYELLDSISHSIIQNVPQINRVVYVITSKPPATIEWE